MGHKVQRNLQMAGGANIDNDLAIDGAAIINSSAPVVIPDATTYTFLRENSGRLHAWTDLTADCIASLPTAEDGLCYELMYYGAIDAQDLQIFTGAAANFFLGGLLQVDDAPAADSVIPDGDSNCRCNILTPEGGTHLWLWCDGTNWFITGTIVSANAPTFADIA